ncbi:MAG: 50S ribosomal protein L15 [Patescibacteria group bacterium]
MNIGSLGSIVKKSKKRVGQGHGSGRGKTAGRGQKGQKARTSVPLDFEGGALPLIKRMPYLRGKGKNKPMKPAPVVLNVSALAKLPAKTTVDIETLVAHNLVDAAQAKQNGVKILGDGDLSIALTVKVAVSKSAAEKIQQAGGSVE